jgi:uncharacterized protein YkwD
MPRTLLRWPGRGQRVNHVTVGNVLRRFGLVGVLAAVAMTVGGAYVADALADVEGAASVGAQAQRMAVPVAPRIADTTGPATSAGNTLAAAVVTQLNAERATRGLAAYVAQPQVTSAAQLHSDDMAAQGRMSHTGSDGSSAGDRLLAQGFAWEAWGENVAAGQRTAADVVSAWMNSSGHRPQMLGSYRYVGVGVTAGADGVLYWTLVVAS